MSRHVARMALAGVALGLFVASSGCAVKAYEREALADPIMAMDGASKEDSRELKWLEAREASNGGIGGAGGGCACN
jgi:hypothetical protein